MIHESGDSREEEGGRQNLRIAPRRRALGPNRSVFGGPVLGLWGGMIFVNHDRRIGLSHSCPRPFEMRLRAGTNSKGRERSTETPLMFWIWTLFLAHTDRLPKGQHRRSTICRWERSAWKERLCCRRMPGDIISLVGFRGRSNHQWTGVVSLSSRRLLPTVLTLAILKSSWQMLQRTAGTSRLSWLPRLEREHLARWTRATSSISSPQLLTLFALIAINQVFRSEALGNIADRTEPPISRGPH